MSARVLSSLCLCACVTSPAPTTTTASAPPSDATPPAATPSASTRDRAPTTPQRPRAAGLAALEPIYDAHLSEAWITVTVPATDRAQWEHVMELTAHRAPLLAGNRAIPAEVLAIGPLFVVSTTGIARVEALARVSAGVEGWLIDYKRGRARAPSIAMRTAPNAEAVVRKGAPTQPIKRTHPMAERMRTMLADAGTPPSMLRQLGRYRMQLTPGRFAGATKVVAVWAFAADDEGGELGVLFTVDAADRTRHTLLVGGEPTVVEGLVDLDGDGQDELLTSSEGDESASRDLRRPTDTGVEVVNLFSHDE